MAMNSGLLAEDFDENEPEVTEDMQYHFRYNQMAQEYDYDEEQLAAEHQQSMIIDHVRSYLVGFYRLIKEQNVYDIHSAYEQFNRMSDTLFKAQSWYPVEYVAPHVQNDRVFLMLYKELYYRHLYSKLTQNLTLEHRFESWANYCELFDFILDADVTRLELELPNQWLWDIVDEFIYQFQAFCQYRSKLKNKKDEQLNQVKESPQIWNVNKVLNYLHALANKGNIYHYLERERQQESDTGLPELTGEDMSMKSLFRMLGYFSIIGLCRVHCLLSDYYLALKVLEPIDLNKKGLFTRVTTCHITLYYYMGFVYLMMRRYADTIRTFSNILLYINRTKQYHSRSMMDLIMKKNEQMFGLLAIAVSLCPQRIDDNIHQLLRDKYGDKLTKMQKGDSATFEELFSYACPKFVNPTVPTQEDKVGMNYAQEALRLQRKVFLSEIGQQELVPTIRSFLKLYTTIRTAKLADFLLEDREDCKSDTPEQKEAALRTYLLCYKHKNRNLGWTGGPPASGKWMSSSDIDFHVELDMVHIADTKVSRRYGEFFIRHINKFEEIISDISGAANPFSKRR